MILVNFKIYKESFGDKAIGLAKNCLEVGKETGIEVIPVVSALDGYRIKKEVKVKVFLQEVDLMTEGAFSGQISMEQAKEAGIDGSLINHSEAKISPGKIRQIVLKKPKGFKLVVCVRSMGQVEKWAKKLAADYLAYEPSYLIGSKDKSVATEKPEVIKKIVEISTAPVLVGAGIKSGSDVKASLKLGAKGVLVASDVVKAADPKKELLELALSFGV